MDTSVVDQRQVISDIGKIGFASAGGLDYLRGHYAFLYRMHSGNERSSGNYLPSEASQKQAVAKLASKWLEQTLNAKNHAWVLNEMDPEEKAQGSEAAAEFKARYHSSP
ncbi:hypothetical protein OAE97_01185 [Verrucomicrobia bacterium]|nr:hypothetical protein [Verrucomicrobiota bacterium]